MRETGYRQTGPTLPEGAGLEDLFVDLRPFWEAVNGDALRQEAGQTVDTMWAEGILQSWADVDQVIEQHVPHPAAEEGLEAAEWEITPDSDEDSGDDTGSGDDSPHGGPGDSPIAPAGVDRASGSSPGGCGSVGGCGQFWRFWWGVRRQGRASRRWGTLRRTLC